MHHDWKDIMEEGRSQRICDKDIFEDEKKL
jgi:hypothetical protein